MKRLLAITLALIMALCLIACAKADTPVTIGGNAGTTTKPDATENITEAPESTTETVLCLTKIISDDGTEELVYNITYEEDGVHVTPEKLVDAYDTLYAPNGNVLWKIRYNDEGFNTYLETYSYNTANQLTEWINWDIVEDCQASRTTRFYNDQGLLVKREFENRAGQINYHELTYDPNGILTVECHYDTDSVLYERYEYASDSNGQLQRCDVYKELNSGEALSEWGIYTYSYDSAGQLLSKVWKQTVTYPMSLISDYYTYDQNGNVTSSDVSHSVTSYTYNEDGYLVGYKYASGSSRTLVYEQMELTAEQAQMAQLWSTDGVKNAFVTTPYNQN